MDFEEEIEGAITAAVTSNNSYTRADVQESQTKGRGSAQVSRCVSSYHAPQYSAKEKQLFAIFFDPFQAWRLSEIVHNHFHVTVVE
mmetsp:Transcript_8833/g.54376  ORF Transcript_8833/g.54376 Transcript_8833/m.54376 type:complete len:86 (-) Transcript_8833:1714-1971(-)